MDGHSPSSTTASYASADRTPGSGLGLDGRPLCQAVTLPDCLHTHCMELPNGATVIPLGVGRKATVHPATSFGTAVAAKIIFDAVTDGSPEADEARAAHQNEVAHLRAFRHTNIVEYVHDAHLPEKGIFVLLTRRYVGRTVADLIRRLDDADAALCAEALVDIALQLAAALMYLHEFGFVHNNITPANMVLSAAPVPDGRDSFTLPPDTELKVIDFGACAQYGTRAEMAMPANGTIDAAGRATPSPTDRDLHGMGEVLHGLLFGRYDDADRGSPADGATARRRFPAWRAASRAARRTRLASTIPDVVALANSLMATDPTVARPSALVTHTTLALARARATTAAAAVEPSPPSLRHRHQRAAEFMADGLRALVPARRSPTPSVGGGSSSRGSSATYSWPAVPPWVELAPLTTTAAWVTLHAVRAAAVAGRPSSGVAATAGRGAAAAATREAQQPIMLTTVEALAGAIRNRVMWLW